MGWDIAALQAAGFFWTLHPARWAGLRNDGPLGLKNDGPLGLRNDGPLGLRNDGPLGLKPQRQRRAIPQPRANALGWRHGKDQAA